MASTEKTVRKANPKSSKPRAPAKAGGRAIGTGAVLSIGAVVLTAGAAIAGFLARRRSAASTPEGHPVPDLAPDLAQPDGNSRAPVDFRPDMDAPMSAEDREALRPPTGPAPSLIAPAGSMNSQTGADN